MQTIVHNNAVEPIISSPVCTLANRQKSKTKMKIHTSEHIFFFFTKTKANKTNNKNKNNKNKNKNKNNNNNNNNTEKKRGYFNLSSFNCRVSFKFAHVLYCPIKISVRFKPLCLDLSLNSRPVPLWKTLVMMMMSWCLMSSDVIWHIRDKLWPMPKHGSIILYVHGNQKAR